MTKSNYSSHVKGSLVTHALTPIMFAHLKLQLNPFVMLCSTSDSFGLRANIWVHFIWFLFMLAELCNE